MPLTADEQAELDALNSEAGVPDQSSTSGNLTPDEQTELENLNALAGLPKNWAQPEPVDLSDRAFQTQMQRGPVNLMSPAVRLATPLVAMAGAESIPALMARGAIGGALGEFIGQGGEIKEGTRTDVSGREIAGAALRNAVPVIGKVPFPKAFPWAQRAIENAILQGGTSAAADVVSGHDPSLAGMAIAGGLGGGFSSVEPLAEMGLRGSAGSLKALAGGAGPGRALRQGFAESIRPIEQTPSQAQALASRAQIARMTGTATQRPVQVPLSTSETLGLKDLSSYMRVPGAELTEDQLNEIANRAVHFAARTERTTRDSTTIGKEVLGSLGLAANDISEPAKLAIEDYTKRAARAINDAEAQAKIDFSLFYPKGREAKEIGQDIGALADLIHSENKAIFKQKYDAAKTLAPSSGARPYYDEVQVPVKPIEDKATQLGLAFAPDDSGGISIISAPPGARSAINAGQSIKGQGMPEYLTLDQARSIHSQLGDMVRFAGATPGVDTYIRSQLLSTVHGQIEKAVSKYPPLKAALSDANRTYAENIERFNNSLSSGILNDAGEKGGLLPEAMVRSLTGPNASSVLDNLEKLVGKGASIGTDWSDEARRLAREAFLEKARIAGGNVDLAQAFDAIKNVPDSVKTRLFPNFSALEDAAEKAGALARVKPAVRKGVEAPDTMGERFALPRGIVEVDANELEKALGTGAVKDLESLASKSVAAKEAMNAELGALSLQDLSKRNGLDVYGYLTSLKDPARASQAMGFIDKANPSLGSDVRALYLDRLLQATSKNDKIDLAALASELSLPSGKTAESAGTAGGLMRPNAVAVLGQTAVDDVKKIAGLMESIPKPNDVTLAQQRGFWHWLLLGNEGTSIASKTGLFGLGARLASSYDPIRYNMATVILSDESLRRQAMQATGPRLRNVLNQAIGIVSQNVASEYGGNSKQANQVKQFQAELNK